MKHALPIVLIAAATAALACQIGGLAPTPTAISVPAATVAPSPTPLPTVPPPTATPSAPVIDALNAAGLAPRFVIPASLNDVKRVTFSPDGRLLATTSGGSSLSSDYAVRLWNPANGSLVFTLEGHAGLVGGVAFAPDGRYLASVSDDKTLRVWDTRAGVVAQVAHLPGPANSVVFSPDGARLVVGVALGKDGLLYNYDLTTGKVQAVAISPNGQLVAGGAEDQSIWIWRLADGQLVTRLTAHRTFLESVAFSPDGRVLASSSTD